MCGETGSEAVATNSRSSSPSEVSNHLDSAEEDVSMKKEVEFLTDSYKLLMRKAAESNQINEQRFRTVEESLKEILKRLDKRLMDDYEDDHRSLVPESSTPHYQVPLRHPEPSRTNNSLGYRSGDLNLTNREKMLKKIEMPSCDGSTINDWMVDIEHFFVIG